MNCEQFKGLVQDLARDEGLDVTTLKDAMEHADGCRPCDELLEEAEALTIALRSLGERYASAEAPAHIERALLRNLALRRASGARSWSRIVSVSGSVAGVAALALLAIFLVPHQPRAFPGQPTPQGFRGLQGHAARPFTSESTAGKEDWLSAFGDDEKVASSFVPLSDTFDPTSVDDDSVVRVVLSRQALDSFGMHLSDASKVEGNNDQVVADLIVTNDGTPQAIRVVGW